MEHPARGLASGEGGELCGIRPLELLRVVAEQPLADQLQQHVVVPLERDIDVEIVVEADEPVLGEEAGAAARLTALLDGVEGVPGRQGLQGRSEGLEILTLGGGVGAAAEDAVERAQQLVAGEELGVHLR